jgi:FkbM family methyltransferase
MTFVQRLHRFPAIFDTLNRLNRRYRHRSPIYLELFRRIPLDTPFTFLQIGANDGISNDPYREFLIRPEARGVTAEPVPEFFAKMRRNYKRYPNVLPNNTAVGYPANTLPFYAYTPQFLSSKGAWGIELAGLASFSRDKLVTCLAPGDSPASCIQEIMIPVRTVEDLMIQNGFDHFDCLFMDCEGHEENILTHMDYSKVKSRLIVFEHTHYGDRAEAIETHLAQLGFTFTRLQYDTIASR